MDPAVYWSALERAVEVPVVLACLLKSVSFGILTISICAYQGFHAHLIHGVAGARAVSAATTRAVVLSSISVLALDYAITSLLV